MAVSGKDYVPARSDATDAVTVSATGAASADADVDLLVWGVRERISLSLAHLWYIA